MRKSVSPRSASRRRTPRGAAGFSKAALGRYLAAGVGATGLATVEAEAGVVQLNLSSLGSPSQNVTGTNGGVSASGNKDVFNSVPLSVTGSTTNKFTIYGGKNSTWGLYSVSNIDFLSNGAYASPTKLSQGAVVGATEPTNSYWTGASRGAAAQSVFRFVVNTYDEYNNVNGSITYTSPDFGPNSYIGFRVVNGNPANNNFNYGYYKVTWDSANTQFQIISGAYESQVNTAITIVPEPSTAAAAGIAALALGAGAIRRSRKARKAAAEESLAEAV